MQRRAIVLAAVLAAAPLAAFAQTYRCIGKDGKRYYGQTLPPQCVGVAVEELNAQGVIVKRYDPQAEAERRAAKAAEEAQARQEENTVREETRRNKALLATYTSEADLESARKRALEDNVNAVKDLEARVALIKRRKDDYAKEMEFYQGKNKPPAKLLEDIKETETDLNGQVAQLEAKKKEVNAINAKYNEDKRRFLELTAGSAKK